MYKSTFNIGNNLKLSKACIVGVLTFALVKMNSGSSASRSYYFFAVLI